MADAGDSAHQRVVLRARVALGERRVVDFFTAHFSLSEAAQQRHVRGELRHWLDTLAQRSPNVPQLLGGDLNALPTAPSMVALRNYFDADLWMLAHRLGRTNGTAETFSTLEKRLRKRIDYLLLRGARVDESALSVATVPDSGTVTSFKKYRRRDDRSIATSEVRNIKLHASDHLALVADVHLHSSAFKRDTAEALKTEL